MSRRAGFAVSLQLLRAAVWFGPLEGVQMLRESEDHEEIIERVAALDIGKAELVCGIRVPSPDRTGHRLQEVARYATMTRSLAVLSDRLHELGVTRVVMEAASDYWRPPFWLLEAAGFETWLVNVGTDRCSSASL